MQGVQRNAYLNFPPRTFELSQGAGVIDTPLLFVTLRST
jgi:hypothetical protein